MKFSTIAVHAGQEPDPQSGAVNVPVHFSSTFKQDGLGGLRQGYEYARTGNPSRRALETTLAALEGGLHGLAFASGQAASTAVLDLLVPGDQIVTLPDIYGGSYRLFHRVIEKYGIPTVVAGGSTPQAVESVLTDKTALVWIESPSNPLLNVLDIAQTVERVHAHFKGRSKRPVVVVDNTFASPALQQPLALGADIVVHSATKYLGGHSDVIAGVVVTNRTELWEKIKFYQNAAGGVPSPLDSYLLQRGIRTLPLRMAKHGENAHAVAEFLRGHAKVETVFFPGFPDHPGYAIARKQMKGLPGMVSFRLRGGIEETRRFFSSIRLILAAESLGGVESLACHPATMTHAAFPPEERNRVGITDNLVRLSLGIEDKDDLIEDIDQALLSI
jgi:cystathionine beta-lyase/cystathionine gamma-synthase